jgi:hypothetical protein
MGVNDGCPKTKSAPLSPMTTDVALVLPQMILGMIDASMIRKP